MEMFFGYGIGFLFFWGIALLFSLVTIIQTFLRNESSGLEKFGWFLFIAITVVTAPGMGATAYALVYYPGWKKIIPIAFLLAFLGGCTMYLIDIFEFAEFYEDEIMREQNDDSLMQNQNSGAIPQ